MKALLLLFAVVALARAGEYVAAACFAVPLAALLGYRRAVRANGVSMIRTGARRALLGKF